MLTAEHFKTFIFKRRYYVLGQQIIRIKNHFLSTLFHM